MTKKTCPKCKRPLDDAERAPPDRVEFIAGALVITVLAFCFLAMPQIVITIIKALR
jgi:hypothetical protein